ncbi:ABC transporter permease [Hahella sp. HN01]|uniref:ABC transporter permease n=1 Tax=Hahella sp. HN01 TaxID=2847262 RepID=UPI001C1F0C21|nr:ABC transporter permease [Hahella sp. HN01]
MKLHDLQVELGLDNLQTDGLLHRAPAPLRVFLADKRGVAGLLILLLLTVAALGAPWLTEFPPDRMSAMPHLPPDGDHWLGTTRMGKDVFAQLLYGAQASLTVGLLAGALATLIGVFVGMCAGYFGGRLDDVISFIVNVALVIPALPLIIVIASFVDSASPMVIGLVLAATGWGWTARIIRAQTLQIRHKDFILAAQLLNEPWWRILAAHILPNMLSLVVSGFVLTTIYAILAEAGLEFIGLGDPSAVTWGTILFWGQQNSALQVGAWWEILPACFAIMLTGAALVLINFTVDEIANPLLRKRRGEKAVIAYLRKKGLPVND